MPSLHGAARALEVGIVTARFPRAEGVCRAGSVLILPDWASPPLSLSFPLPAFLSSSQEGDAELWRGHRVLWPGTGEGSHTLISGCQRKGTCGFAGGEEGKGTIGSLERCVLRLSAIGTGFCRLPRSPEARHSPRTFLRKTLQPFSPRRKLPLPLLYIRLQLHKRCK